MTERSVDPRWLADAACRLHPEVDFFATEGAMQRQPLAICAACSVRVECLEYALAGHEVGIWGGTSERMRARIRRSSWRVEPAR